MKKIWSIVFFLITATIFNGFTACKKSSKLPSSITPIDSLYSIVGTYVGTVHYTYSFFYHPSTDSSFDTTYSFKFIVSKVSQDTFTTNTSYNTCYFSGSTTYGYFAYSSSNIYEVTYFSCADMFGTGGWGIMNFYPTSDSVRYSLNYEDEEGGGSVFFTRCTETFSGKKL